MNDEIKHHPVCRVCWPAPRFDDEGDLYKRASIILLSAHCALPPSPLNFLMPPNLKMNWRGKTFQTSMRQSPRGSFLHHPRVHTLKKIPSHPSRYTGEGAALIQASHESCLGLVGLASSQASQPTLACLLSCVVRRSVCPFVFVIVVCCVPQTRGWKSRSNH